MGWMNDLDMMAYIIASSLYDVHENRHQMSHFDRFRTSSVVRSQGTLCFFFFRFLEDFVVVQGLPHFQTQPYGKIVHTEIFWPQARDFPLPRWVKGKPGCFPILGVPRNMKTSTNWNILDSQDIYMAMKFFGFLWYLKAILSPSHSTKAPLMIWGPPGFEHESGFLQRCFYTKHCQQN